MHYCYYYYYYKVAILLCHLKTSLAILNWHHLTIKLSVLSCLPITHTQHIHTLLSCSSKLCRQKKMQALLSSRAVTTLAFPEKQILWDITCKLSSWTNILWWRRKKWEFQRHDNRRQITMAAQRKLYFSLGLKLQTQNTARRLHIAKQAASGIINLSNT